MENFLKIAWESIKSIPSLIENLSLYINKNLNFLPNELKVPFLSIIALIVGIFIYRLMK